MHNNTEFSEVIKQINEPTEITIARLIDGEYEWYWWCKESEATFKTPELALVDAVNFICQNYEALLIATLAKEEDAEDADE